MAPLDFRFLFVLLNALLSFVFIVAGLAVPKWVTQNEVSMGIVACVNCEGEDKGWSWECFAHSYCNSYVRSVDCEVFENGYETSSYFLCFEVVALMMSVLLLEKSVLAFTSRDYGNYQLFYVYGFAMFLSHLLGTSFWVLFAIRVDLSEATLEEGFMITLITIVIMVLTLFSLMFIPRDSRIYIGVDSGLFLYLSIRTWMLVFLWALSFVLLLLLTGTMLDSWVRGETLSLSFEGSLFRCDTCHEAFEWFRYDCLAGIECELNDNLAICRMYSSLSQAAQGFLKVEIAVLCFLSLHIQTVTGILTGRDYGNKYFNYVCAM